MAHPDARREEVLALLKANGGNVKRTARESGDLQRHHPVLEGGRPVLGGKPPPKKEPRSRSCSSTSSGLPPACSPGSWRPRSPRRSGPSSGSSSTSSAPPGGPTTITGGCHSRSTALHGRMGQLASRNGTGLVPLGVNGKEATFLTYEWAFWARDDQLPAGRPWRVWLLLAGRGFGKTRTGAEWIRAEVEAGRRSGSPSWRRPPRMRGT